MVKTRTFAIVEGAGEWLFHFTFSHIKWLEPEPFVSQKLHVCALVYENLNYVQVIVRNQYNDTAWK